jgi:hypothetical protein
LGGGWDGKSMPECKSDERRPTRSGKANYEVGRFPGCADVPGKGAGRGEGNGRRITF